MLDILAFDLVPRVITSEVFADATVAGDEAEQEETPFVSLWLAMRVNGTVLIESHSDAPVFDPSCVLGQALDAGYFLPYTCGCGEPGCVGIDLKAHMRADADIVTWRFPEQPFRTWMAPRVIQGRKPIVFRFARAQYEAALLDLAQRYHPYYTGELKADFVIGVDHYDRQVHRHAGKTLTQMLEDFRGASLKRLARQEKRESLLGPLLDATVEMTWPDGARASVLVETLAQHLAYEEEPLLEDERTKALERITSEFRSLEGAVCAEVKKLGFGAIEPCCSLRASGMWDFDKDPEGGIRWLASRWDKVRLTLLPSEMRDAHESAGL